VVGVFDAWSKEEVDAAFRKIFHYGKYSVLFFDHGINVYKKKDQTVCGIAKELFKKATAVQSSTLKNLPDGMRLFCIYSFNSDANSCFERARPSLCQKNVRYS